MRKIILSLLILFSIVACEKDDNDLLKSSSVEQDDFKAGKAKKIDVCHYSEEDDSWHLITINENAWKAHEKHGDVWLDRDGDGSTPFNECGIGDMLDSDDTDSLIIQAFQISDIGFFYFYPLIPDFYMIGLQITGINLPAEATKYLIKVNNVERTYNGDGYFAFKQLTPELVEIGLIHVHLVGLEQEEFIDVTVILNSGEYEFSIQLPNPI